jgi:hypothetical protein
MYKNFNVKLLLFMPRRNCKQLKTLTLTKILTSYIVQREGGRVGPLLHQPADPHLHINDTIRINAAHSLQSDPHMLAAEMSAVSLR